MDLANLKFLSLKPGLSVAVLAINNFLSNFLINILKYLHKFIFLTVFFLLYEDKVLLQLMPARASLKRFNERYFVFIK